MESSYSRRAVLRYTPWMESFDALKNYNDTTGPNVEGNLAGYVASPISVLADGIEKIGKAGVGLVTSPITGIISGMGGGKIVDMANEQFVQPIVTKFDEAKDGLIQGSAKIATKGILQLVGPEGMKWVNDQQIAGAENWLKNVETMLVSMVVEMSGFKSDGTQLGHALLMAKGEGLAKSFDLAGGLKAQLDQTLANPDGQYMPPAAKVEEAVARGIANATLSGEQLKSDMGTAATNWMAHLGGKPAEKPTPGDLAYKIDASIRAEVFQTAVTEQLAGRSLASLSDAEKEKIFAAGNHAAERISGMSLAEAQAGKAADGEHHGMFALLKTKLEQINGAAGAEPKLDLKPATVDDHGPAGSTPAQPTDTKSKTV